MEKLIFSTREDARNYVNKRYQFFEIVFILTFLNVNFPGYLPILIIFYNYFLHIQCCYQIFVGTGSKRERIKLTLGGVGLDFSVFNHWPDDSLSACSECSTQCEASASHRTGFLMHASIDRRSLFSLVRFSTFSAIAALVMSGQFLCPPSSP